MTTNFVFGLKLVSDPARVIIGEESFVDIDFQGVVGSGDTIIGLNVAVTPSGSAGMLAKSLHCKFDQGTSKKINGYVAVGEFEMVMGAGLYTPSDCATLWLIWDDGRTYAGGSSPITNSPYIMCRDSSTTQFQNACFVRFYDVSPATKNPATLLSDVTSGFEANCSHTIRCMYGTTPLWLLATTTAPA